MKDSIVIAHMTAMAFVPLSIAILKSVWPSEDGVSLTWAREMFGSLVQLAGFKQINIPAGSYFLLKTERL
jgi:hypothetical protein